jgi:endonuclease/exonuclease/phosphatase family metal-dependent hydrolase
MTTSRIKVLTYNIHKGFGPANWGFALHDIRSKLESARADVVFLQEIQGLHVRREARIKGWPKGSQFEYLADRLWPHHAYGKNAIYKYGHHGNAILSRYPFQSWENINVSRYARASRSILHGVLRIPPDGRPLHTVCIHFDFVPHHRRRQVDALVQRIETHIPKGEPLIVAGDFNDWQGQMTDDLGPESELVEVFQRLKGRHAGPHLLPRSGGVAVPAPAGPARPAPLRPPGALRRIRPSPGGSPGPARVGRGLGVSVTPSPGIPSARGGPSPPRAPGLRAGCSCPSPGAGAG